MTQLRNQGGHDKVERRCFFPTQSLERFVIHALQIYLKILPIA